MTTTIEAATTFSYGRVRLKDIRPLSTWNDKRHVVGSVEVGDEGPALLTQRFWTSLEGRFQFSKKIFKYFTPREVFDRVSEKAKNDEFRYCIEEDRRADGRVVKSLLAVTSPAATVIPYTDLLGMLSSEGGETIRYAGGVLNSSHVPRNNGGAFGIGPDLFENRFHMATPVDGWGPPSAYVSMLRLVCQNGMIGRAAAFRTETKLSPKDADALHNLRRFIESFNNPEGFGALRQRYESAQTSWASVREAQKVYRLLLNLSDKGQLTRTALEPTVVVGVDGSERVEMRETNGPVFKAFNDVVGDMHDYYGVASMEALSVKKQRVLPVRCTVYDLLNLVSEVATHGATEGGSRSLQALIGDLIGDPAGYDMEGTKTQIKELADFLLQDKQAQRARDMVRAGMLKEGDRLLDNA